VNLKEAFGEYLKQRSQITSAKSRQKVTSHLLQTSQFLLSHAIKHVFLDTHLGFSQQSRALLVKTMGILTAVHVHDGEAIRGHLELQHGDWLLSDVGEDASDAITQA
jgi:hypothetical protein